MFLVGLAVGVTAGLEPTLKLGVKQQQCFGRVVVEHDGRSGEMPRHRHSVEGSGFERGELEELPLHLVKFVDMDRRHMVPCRTGLRASNECRIAAGEPLVFSHELEGISQHRKGRVLSASPKTGSADHLPPLRTPHSLARNAVKTRRACDRYSRGTHWEGRPGIPAIEDQLD